MRLPDWPQRLDAAVNVASGRHFRYGTFDCCLFAADVVLAITGTDYAADLRGYKGRRGAREVMRANGGLVCLLSRLLGESLPAAHARRGDVVFGYVMTAENVVDEGAVGICLGRLVVFAAPHGLAFHPRTVCLYCWRI